MSHRKSVTSLLYFVFLIRFGTVVKGLAGGRRERSDPELFVDVSNFCGGLSVDTTDKPAGGEGRKTRQKCAKSCGRAEKATILQSRPKSFQEACFSCHRFPQTREILFSCSGRRAELSEMLPGKGQPENP